MMMIFIAKNYRFPTNLKMFLNNALLFLNY
jgi:hypothetical protein